MAQDVPYCLVYGKIPELLRKIADAKVPDTFSHAFLKDTLGFKSSNDRSLFGIVKALGLIDTSGKPTPRYRELKNSSSKGLALAAGIREAYAPVFDANENANTLANEELKGLIAQVTGADKDMTSRIAYTLNTLIKEADFSAPSQVESKSLQEQEVTEEKKVNVSQKKQIGLGTFAGKSGAEFHFNIQVHLPNNGTEETYLNIFNALRETFQ